MSIVNVYKVVYHNNRHNGPNASKMTAYVVAASSDAAVIASTLQTNDGNGKTVTIESIDTYLTGAVQ